ncbi:(R)-stereoselective amidase [Luteitalea pratensis]|uniref:(R)-stereoselective amidase n=1 Tax=Luteitalea pratensis TaxID=1855912 RepID=A0A143PPY9_LUTPR|nr:carbon-nitrogen hydrolase family protein [Luteitalea pratensis]AMY10655.1 (R)-stereoselective amidase [Luteitalea pratensis]
MPQTRVSVRLVLAQLRVDPGERAATLTRALQRIDDAARRGADVVLLPEALPLGWMAADTHARADAIPDGTTCVAFREAAARHHVFVCTGIVERAGDVVFNAAVLIDPDGQVLLHHRKVNELEIAHDLYARGDRLGVVDTRLGRIGLMICADAFAPGEVVSRTLALMGADMILSPCAWAVPPDHDHARAPYGDLWRRCYGIVAREHSVWIAGASNVGPITFGAWDGHACIGCSLVVGPDGEPRLEGPYGADADALLMVDMEMGQR